MTVMARRSFAAAYAMRFVACGAAFVACGAAHASPAQDYMLNCMGCHGTEAQGVPGKVPPLANSLTRFMRTPEGRNYVLRVPGAANSTLSDTDLAAVLNWLAMTYDASAATSAEAKPLAPFTSEEVTRSRHTPLVSVLATRTAVIKSLSASGPAPPSQY